MSEPASSARAGSGAGRPSVVYVMGAGRSGSTILGVALGNCDGVFYAGELDKWLMRSGTPALGGAERERFWDKVRETVDASDLFGFEARPLERSSSLLRPSKWSVRRRVRVRYREISEQLYRAIADAAENTYLVDTSHYPLRARELQSLTGIELYLIWLVRDPRGVVASFAKPDVAERRFGVLTTNAYLYLTHLVSLAVYLRHPRERRVFVRYEDLMGDPQRTVRGLLDRFGSAAAIPDFGELHTGLPIQGNRLLFSPVVKLERREPAFTRSVVTTTLQLPWRFTFAWLERRDPLGIRAQRPEQRSARLDTR